MGAVQLKWKKDWDDAKRRLAVWWRGECLDRVALGVIAPRNEPIEQIPVLEPPSDLILRWTDPIFRINEAERQMAASFFGGEAFPYFDTHIGPGTLATFLGSEPLFSKDTVWYFPSIKDPERCEPLSFDSNNKWWRIQRLLITEGVRHSRERYLVGMPDLIEGLDTLASLRGTQNLLLDLRQRPRFIHDRLEEITDLYFVYFDELYKLIRDEVGGNCFSAFRIWGPGKTAKVQCDFSAMISPAMFEEFVVPYLRIQCSRLDYSVYHLDGTDCIRHLGLLLKIEELDAIQWTPQYGRPDPGSQE